MSKYFEEAVKLVKRDPLPLDIIEKLDELFDLSDEDELENFPFLYESVYQQIDEIGYVYAEE